MATASAPSSTIAASGSERLSVWGASLIVHGCLLGIFALIGWPAPTEDGEFGTIVDVAPAEPRVELETLPAPPTLRTASAAGTASPVPFEVVDSRDKSDAAPRFDAARPLELSLTGTAAGALTEKVAVIPRIAVGQGDAAGSGSGNGGGFFGIDLRHPSVVFVVDASRSMNHPYPGETKTRFGRVKLELLQTVAAMSSDQRFFLAFFNTVALPMPADRLMEATPGAKQVYLQWMTALKAEGKTNPEQALLGALQLNPAVIYFLTDGDFDYKVVPNVSKANVRGVVIHTIGFGDDKGAKLLSELAARNGGTYKFIPETAAEPRPENKAGDQAASIISQLGSQ